MGFNEDIAVLREENERLKSEVKECDALREQMATLLSETAVALKGPEGPLQRHSWADLPTLAAELRLAVDLEPAVTGQRLADERRKYDRQLYDKACEAFEDLRPYDELHAAFGGDMQAAILHEVWKRDAKSNDRTGGYVVEIIPERPEDGGGFCVLHPQLKGCISQGDTTNEALANLAEARELWTESCRETGHQFPPPYEDNGKRQW